MYALLWEFKSSMLKVLPSAAKVNIKIYIYSYIYVYIYILNDGRDEKLRM